MERLTYKFNTLSLANFAANAIKKDGVGVVVANNNSFVVVDTTDAEAATRIVESARGYEVMREAVGQPTKPVAIIRPANPVVAKLVNYKVPMHMVRQYPILKKKKDSMPGSKIMWSHTSGDNDLDVIAAKDVEGYMRAGWVIIEQTGENEWEIQSLTEKTKLTPDQLKAANTSLRSKMIKKGAKKEEAELEEEQVDVQEGGVKAAIEDFMYDMLPKQAISELKPIMKNQSIRGADLLNKVTAVLKKHKVPLMHLGGSSAELVIDYFDTFHGESVEVAEALRFRQQDWEKMRAKYKQGTPVNITLKSGKTVSGTLLRMDKYDQGFATKGHLLHVKTSSGKVKIDDVDVKSIQWNNNPKTKISEEVEVAEQLKAGDKVKVPHKGKMVRGRIVRHDKGGSSKAAQHGGGYVVDVGEPASILVPAHKIVKEEVEQIDELTVPQTHALAIARKTVKMNDVMAKVMGGMSKKDAHEFLLKNGTAAEKAAAKKFLGMKEEVEIAENSWGGGFQSAADAHRQVQAGLKADFQRERAQKLKLIVQVIRGEISKQKFKKLTGSNYDELMKNSPYFRNQVKRMPKKALEPVAKAESVEVDEAYAPLDTPNIIGAFTETTKKKRFEYRKSTDKWGISHGLPHEVCVKENSPSEWRSANVKGTVCYIATDEGEGGKPVLEKWTISNHVKYVKAEEIEHGGNGEIELDEAPMVSPEAGLGIFGYSKPQFEAKMRQLIQKMGFEKGINRTEMSNDTMTLYFANRAKAQDFMVTFNGMVRRTASGIVAKLVPSAAMSSDQSKKAMGSEALVILDLNKMKKESAEFEAILQNLEEEVLDEKLIGKQKKLDVNKNDKLDAQDFKILRAKKAKKEEVEVNEAMNNYIAFYNGKKMTVQAETSYKAQLKAIEMFKAPASKKHMVTVKLADNKAAFAANEEVEIDEAGAAKLMRLAKAHDKAKYGSTRTGITNPEKAKRLGVAYSKMKDKFIAKQRKRNFAPPSAFGMKEEADITEAAPAIKASMRLYAKQDKKTDNGSVVKGQYYKVVDAGNGLFDLIHQSTGYRKAMHKVTASAIQAMIQNKIF